jgi:site-specific DNA-methyltransferase (adenine-specific)
MPAASVDMIACDLPYGTTYADWDTHIPIDDLWQQYRRLIKGNGAIVLTASQPFTSLLVTSNPAWFRCEWIWNKVHGANFANANRQPLKVHESVLVFARGQTVYNPIKIAGQPNHKQGSKMAARYIETMLIHERVADDLSGMKFPGSIQTFPKHSSQCGQHPTQKPLALMDYFIRTYSNRGDIVLDNCMGSGTTGVAARLAGRQFIGIEKDPKHYATAQHRMATEADHPCITFTES